MGDDKHSNKNKNLIRIDHAYLFEVMSFEERIKMLEDFEKNTLIVGIDKGTYLEECRRERIRQVRKNIVQKKFFNLMDHMNEVIVTEKNKNNRKHYRSKDYKNKKEKAQEEARKKAYENALALSPRKIPPWLQPEK